MLKKNRTTIQISLAGRTFLQMDKATSKDTVILGAF